VGLSVSKAALEKPKPMGYGAPSNPGHIVFTLECCDIDGKKTIHLDLWDNKGIPYGHIGPDTARRIKRYLSKAIAWMDQK